MVVMLRHLTPTSDCPRCAGVEESLTHIFRECPVARETWQRLGVHHQGFFALPFETWIKVNAKARPPQGQSNTPWFLIFLGAIWYLWKGRNLWIFEHQDTTAFQIARKALSQARDTASALALGAIVTNRESVLVKWTPPRQDFYKLNTDGALNHVTKKASAGGLIRDTEGCWVQGFMVNIGPATSFLAELWGLREGLRLCLSLNIQQIEIEMDSAVIVNKLQDQNRANQVLSTLMVDCQRLLQQFRVVHITHIYREGNSVADRLANMGQTSQIGTTILQAPPQEVSLLLSRDKSGHTVARF